MEKQISNFEEACQVLGLDSQNVLPDVSNTPFEDKALVLSTARMAIIQKALNGDWKADWSNSSQYKYYPWYRVIKDNSKPSGFGLSLYVVACGYAFTRLGVRLYYKDAETAQYAFETFKEDYENMVLIP